MKYTKIIEVSDIVVSLIEVWHNITKCLICALAFFALGILLTLGNNIENTYYASTNLYCPVNSNYSEASSAVAVISSYANLIESQKVAERAASLLENTNIDYRSIQNMISYTTSTSGINLSITAYSSDPEIAIRVANAVANAFVEEMRNMMGMDVIQILSAADRANLSSNGIVSLWESRIIFLLIGFIISALIIFFKELFSDKIRSLDQCIIADEDVLIGVIPIIKDINE